MTPTTQRKNIPIHRAVETHKSSIRLSVRYNCGCQFVTTNPREAGEHVVKTGHVVSMAGLMKPPEGWVRPLKEVGDGKL